MRRAVRKAVLAGLLAAGIALPIGGESSIVHKPAPQFVRRDLRGKAVSLRRNRGKVVLLNFWATWCAPCQEELPRFALWQKQYRGEGLQVIAVSMDDDVAPVRALAGRLRLDFPVVMGDAELGRRYGGILGLPVTFLIGRNGVIADRYEGDVRLADMEERLRQLLELR